MSVTHSLSFRKKIEAGEEGRERHAKVKKKGKGKDGE